MSEFSVLVDALDKISTTSSRNAKIDIVAEVLRALTTDEVGIAALYLSGRVFSEADRRTLNVSWSGIMSALRTIIDFTQTELDKYYTGDIGEAVATLLEEGGHSLQTSLFTEPLTITFVYETLSTVAEFSGKGSKNKKETALSQLFLNASPQEIRYLIAIILEDTRTGLSEGLLAEGIAKAFEIESGLVRRAWSFIGDLGEIARIASTEGIEGIRKIRVKMFRPIKPMLATSAESVTETMGEVGPLSLEMKFDGARVQIHKNGDIIRIFSRRLADVTDSLPEIVDIVKDLDVERVILDGEVVAVNRDGKPYPFQTVMRRFGRVRDVEEVQQDVGLQLYLFDILLLDDEQLVDLSYKERREVLERICPSDFLTECLVTDDTQLAEQFFKKSQLLGHEGVMVKKLTSPYIPGARGKNWYKIKHTLDTLDLVVIAAEWGYGRRSKWLSDYHLGVWDEENESFAMVGKTFKGLTDKELQEMTDQLLSLKIGQTRRVVKVIPEIVVEVLASEIQESPTYKSGMALRFARIVRIRDDKVPSEATTLEELQNLFERQFRYKARLEN